MHNYYLWTTYFSQQIVRVHLNRSVFLQIQMCISLYDWCIMYMYLWKTGHKYKYMYTEKCTLAYKKTPNQTNKQTKKKKTKRSVICPLSVARERPETPGSKVLTSISCHWHPEMSTEKLAMWEPEHGHQGKGRPRTSFVDTLKDWSKRCRGTFVADGAHGCLEEPCEISVAVAIIMNVSE